ncbi:flagellar biosynthesis protein FlhB [Kordiimonas laminariae]|uniref:flagellar biosynthesis protein FlhB n=1 Tax=Kordiimonas laminariae TaxID=2917717 RepID=UPI001FF58699|nr:flagellar biosynthesis protein FlhB [Kordiimonas laminariae]MCK0069800.1 flagellar biosynthesis protein FlhB [Kordiimonas laminariae]
MSEEDDSQKTEEPTAKRLREAEEKGEVAQSQELKTWLMLLVAAGVLAGFGDSFASGVMAPLQGFLSQSHSLSSAEVDYLDVVSRLFRDIYAVMALPLGIFVIAAIAANRMQKPFLFTTEKIKPDLKNLSIMKGFKKIYSARFFVEFGKISAKLAAVAGVLFLIIYPEREKLDTIMLLAPIEILAFIKLLAIKLLIGVLIVLTVVAAIDYSYQSYEHVKNLRMTKQEVKDEQKQTDGDPKVKARLRQIRYERHNQRMMSNVPKADVVITNPTHYAVALEYKHETMEVPVLVAKGVDDVAMRIRGIAEENDIPIMENPPLARALHASVELDEEIPPDHYKAVAEVISYIMKLRRAGLKPS